MVRAEGLEPPRPKPPEPKSGVSTNSTTPAYGATRSAGTLRPGISSGLDASIAHYAKTMAAARLRARLIDRIERHVYRED